VKPCIAIAGALARKPFHGGHTWVLLQYLLGFRKLGWKVVFIDTLGSDLCVDERGQHCVPEESVNWRVFREVLGHFGLLGDSCLVLDGGRRFLGLAREDLLARVRGSVFLLNIMGYLDQEEILAQAPRRVFLDIDPGFGQMWARLGLADLFEGHDDFVTIGGNIGRPGCPVPTCGLSWITSPQPIVLEHWPARLEAAPRYLSSIVSWRGAYGPVVHEGQTYGLRAPEFRKFVEMPVRSGRDFLLALDIHPADGRDLERLRENGWRIVSPVQAAGDVWSYRRFIQGSSAEFGVAKDMYVKTASGWFSDRSICYLASGKPVLAQDTGLAEAYPAGEGLLLFTTPEEALAAVDQVWARYPAHARAARAIAEAHFDSDRVLRALLDALGVETARAAAG